MKRSAKIILATAVVGTLGLSGLVKIANARQPQSQVAVMRQHHQNSLVAEAKQREGNSETNDDDLKERQEAANLQPLAKITPQQAQQAAQTSQGGKARSVKLENEDGNLVYAVEIGQKKVKVDAGNGQVLYTDDANSEGQEGSRPRSSIQVSDRDDGDSPANDRGER